MREEERTFVALKPDAVKRGLMGKIIERFENKGLKIIGMKMLQVTNEIAEKHYEEHIGKPFYPSLVKYITSGPIVAMVIQGFDAVAAVRQMVGATNPLNADVGTIRADFAQVMQYNVIHASDSVESGKREIGIYFKPEEIFDSWESQVEKIVYEQEREF
ncbi:nucleoside-diphosphate kinase [bacterium]|nr:nucleoside-diphosphate kinase [bacterium]